MRLENFRNVWEFKFAESGPGNSMRMKTPMTDNEHYILTAGTNYDRC